MTFVLWRYIQIVAVLFSSWRLLFAGLRTAPDWGGEAPAVTTTPVLDLGELAARLGSPVVFSRTGRVVRIIDSEFADRQGNLAASGGVSASTVDATKSRIGAYSIKEVADAVANAHAYATFNFMVESGGKHGIEVSFHVDDEPLQLDIEFNVVRDDLSTLSRIRYDFNTTTWYYYNSAGSFVSLGNRVTINPTSANMMWYTLKLVVNSETGYYDHLSWGTDYVDLSDLAAYTSTGATLQYNQGIVRTRGAVGAGGTIYVDDIIFTIEEE